MTIGTPAVMDRMVERLDHAVLGPSDGRSRVRQTTTSPFNSVCHIERDFGTGRLSGCSAFLVAPRLLITAGHCLFSPSRRRPPKRIRISPGRNGATRPYGAQWASAWFAHPRFFKAFDARYDYGVILLPKPFAGLTPAFVPVALSTARLAGVRQRQPLRIAGFPSDKPRGQMWDHAERLDRISERVLHYSVDTCPGHSGAPVWIRSGAGPAFALAIHTRGPRPSARGPWGCRPAAPLAPPGAFNAGVRITPEVLAAVRSAPLGQGPLKRLSSLKSAATGG